VSAEPVSAVQLQQPAPDWQVLFEGAVVVDRHPRVELRPGSVTVSTRGPGGLDDRDLALALAVSAAAAELGAVADPTRVQTVQLTLDAATAERVMPFWSAVLGYDLTDEDVVDRLGRGPDMWFQPMDPPRTERNRVHVDVSVPADQAHARVDAALAAGGRLVSDAQAPRWWTLADPEGNEVDVAAWAGQQES
jgi:4a-hydroxytetrahydrobiopterin dehydratase